MPSLDAVSIAVFLWLVSGVLASGMTMLWRWEHTQHGFGFWAAAQWALSLALLFLLLRLLAPLWISILLGNGLLFAAFVLMRAGFQRYRGRPVRVQADILVALTGVFALLLLHALDVHLDYRIALSSATAALLGLRCLSALWPTPERMRVAFRAAQTLFGVVSLLSAGRAATSLIEPGGSASLFQSDAFQGTIYLLLAIVSLLLPFVLLILNSLRNLGHLRLAQAEAESAAATDYLTGLANRRRMFETLQALPPDAPVALCLIDLDDFKRVNDRFGHATGDRVLAALGRMMHDLALDDELPVRVGGEEFAFLSTSGAHERLARLAETLRGIVARRLALAVGLDGHVTCSIGVAHGRAGGIDAVLGRADAALYEAKRAGKNRVRVAAEPAEYEDSLESPHHVRYRAAPR
jgi:diguanylate cyclase (GGDEF)-like protein